MLALKLTTHQFELARCIASVGDDKAVSIADDLAVAHRDVVAWAHAKNKCIAAGPAQVAGQHLPDVFMAIAATVDFAATDLRRTGNLDLIACIAAEMAVADRYAARWPQVKQIKPVGSVACDRNAFEHPSPAVSPVPSPSP